ncbi:DUF2306 domain-containing protein [Micromonospora echinofusca]|uniref:DUF2306 domain-containing protein n=1 Tax=Micromonospora echinofusca TaxID=47858 RepID=A0ABS3VPH8_MICEH|nr:DUF2306 domain-containing protein [Micromonospora echinofusca]MBO4206454.1 DUF2306 domain-containing protein [Micromonospora echinofusca]
MADPSVAPTIDRTGDVPVDQPGGPAAAAAAPGPPPATPAGRPSGAGPERRTRWWRRPWVGPLAVVAVAFVAFSLPPYLTLDPARSRIPTPSDLGWYHPMLVVHVVFGAVALLTCCLQVWPRFRRRYPVAHRRIGRVYVFAGVLPAVAVGLPLGAVSPFGPVARVSNVLMASLWLLCTVAGYRAARQRRYGDHRRWMVRSFALTASIITNRVWGVVWTIALWPQLDTTFGGDQERLTQTVAGITTWLGWVLPLLIAQWWLDRTSTSRR